MTSYRAVGDVVGVGIDLCIFQRGSILQNQLSVDGCAVQEFSAVIIVVIHGERSAILHFYRPLHHGIPQGQLRPILHKDFHAAQDIHVHQRQVAALRQNKHLGLHGAFLNGISQFSVRSAGMGSVPRLQILRNHNGFIARIQSEVLDGPRLHVVHVFPVGCLGAVAQHQLIFQSFFSAKNTERKCVAGRLPTQFVRNGYADVVGSGLRRCSGQCDGTVVDGIDAGHSGIISIRRIVTIYDIDG